MIDCAQRPARGPDVAKVSADVSSLRDSHVALEGRHGELASRIADMDKELKGNLERHVDDIERRLAHLSVQMQAAKHAAAPTTTAALASPAATNADVDSNNASISRLEQVVKVLESRITALENPKLSIPENVAARLEALELFMQSQGGSVEGEDKRGKDKKHVSLAPVPEIQLTKVDSLEQRDAVQPASPGRWISGADASDASDILVTARSDSSLFGQDAAALLESADKRFQVLEEGQREVHTRLEVLAKNVAALKPAQEKQTLETFMFGKTSERTPAGKNEYGSSEYTSALEDWQNLEKDDLDGYTYTYGMEESVWDCMTFAFSPAVGFGTSLMLLITWILNLYVQIVFCKVVAQYMLNDPVDGQHLDGLLRFRATIAHNVEYATKANRNSLLDQVCTGSSNLHLASQQMQSNGDMSEFYQGAAELCILAQFAWICTILVEILATVKYARAVMSMERGPSLSFEASGDPESSLTVRVKSISLLRVLFSLFFVFLPRFAIAVILGIIGTFYLAVTTSMSDLLLNAMALAFIIDVDSLLFLVLVPNRMKSLINKIEPAVVKNGFIQRKLGSTVAFLRFGLLVTLLLCVWFFHTSPFFVELKQAMDIVCSGNKHFVTAMSKSTGIMHTSLSQQVDKTWTLGEKSVLQLASMEVNPKSRWGQSLDKELLKFMSSNESMAVIDPPADNIDKAVLAPRSFDFIADLSVMAVENSEFLTCQDMEAGHSKESTLAQLRDIVGDPNAPLCDERDPASYGYYWDKCNQVNLTALRAICPRFCQCHKPISMMSGALQHPKQGCPSACSSVRNALMEAALLNGTASTRCINTPTPALYLQHAQMDKNTFLWFTRWVQTTIEILRKKPNFWGNVYANAMDLTARNRPQSMELADYFATGKEWETAILENRWDDIKGNQEKATGCAYFTSLTLRWLLAYDFCSGFEMFSLRYMCPEACGCGTAEGCPTPCTWKHPPQRPCADNSNGLLPREAMELTLSSIVGNPDIKHCEQIPFESLYLCNKMENRLLREICPLRCGCHSPVGYHVGFFGSGDWGCPDACDALRSARTRFDSENNNALEKTRGCDDVSASSLLPFDEKAYNEINPMNFDFTDISLWFTPYIDGLFSYLFRDLQSFTQVVHRNVQLLGEFGILPSSTVGPLIQWILSGNIKDTILSGTWELMPGFPHPFAKTGCEYMTSWLIQWMFGFDACGSAGAEYRTLRYYCPDSCGCGAMSGCPTKCLPDFKTGLPAPAPPR
eukprot:TRINITY_DN23324_c0_g2_i1.p1 TRINITY_DN23324_c0_g2~~TRINITY_DN23324_c0_g2_i1.p1  ORF type:complete len:1265 (-),score=241.32 TRINITY_DN23324_c0_g2_i1:304-4029(-)